MTDKQKQTIIKLKEEVIILKRKNTDLRKKYGLKKLKGYPKEKPTPKIGIIDCQECGQRIVVDQKHTLEDCKKYSQSHGKVKQ